MLVSIRPHENKIKNKKVFKYSGGVFPHAVPSAPVELDPIIPSLKPSPLSLSPYLPTD